MNYCIYGASSDAIDRAYIEAGEELGRTMARHGHGMVFGGGASGLMGAAARGISEIGGQEIIGVAPHFFRIDGVLYSGCTRMVYTDTMRERKQKMEEMASGFIITPGGLGTMDEFFEILTLKQLGAHGKPVAIYNVRGYYDLLGQFLKQMAEQDFMKEASLRLFHMTDDPEELVSWIEKQDEKRVNLGEMKTINWTLKETPPEG